MSQLTTKILHHGDDLSGCFAVRHEVFVVGQGIDANLERDVLDVDPSTMHVVGEWNGTPAGAARVVFPKPDKAKIGRMAVLDSHRGKGIAQQMMVAILNELARRKIPYAELSAQAYVAKLYEKAGFKIVGEEYMEAGIPHVKMTKYLTKENDHERTP